MVDTFDWMDPAVFLPFPEAEPSFEKNLGIVTIRKRISGVDDNGHRAIAYRDPRSAKIADDGTTLVYFVTPEHYFTYPNVMAFMKNQDDSGKVLAAAPPM